MSLHTTVLGDHGPTVAFCHGLFGQGKNWTQIAKALSTDHRVVLVDMPNHGRSPWTETFDYLDLADQVAETLRPEAPLAAGTEYPFGYRLTWGAVESDDQPDARVIATRSGGAGRADLLATLAELTHRHT